MNDVADRLKAGGVDVLTYPSNNNAMYSGIVDNWPVSVMINSGTLIFSVNRSKDEDLAARLRVALPEGATLKWDGNLIVSFKRKVFNADPMGLTRAAIAALKSCGLSPKDECPICHRPNCDCAAPFRETFRIYYSLTHKACLAARRDSLEEKREDNLRGGSYLLGFVGAVLGMIVGCVPSALTVLYANKIAAVCFALIPLCTYYGYKFFGGKMNRAPLIICILLIVPSVAVLYVMCLIGAYIREYPGALDLQTIIRSCIAVVRNKANYPKIMKTCKPFLIFDILGVACAWRFISWNTKKAVKEGNTIISLAKPWSRETNVIE